MVELTIGSDTEDSGGGSTDTDMVSNIERAMQNEQIRGMLSAVLQNQGVDPTQFGLSQPNPQQAQQAQNAEQQVSDEPQELPEATEGVSGLSASTISELAEQIAKESPMGQNTTLGMVIQHCNDNPEEINQALEKSGLR